jgi:hypothetical protein
MEMWRVVIAEVHEDHDSVELAEPGHGFTLGPAESRAIRFMKAITSRNATTRSRLLGDHGAIRLLGGLG